MDEKQPGVIESLRFDFTDRTDDARCLRNFITNEDAVENLVWLSGEEGVGVSRLIDEVILNLDRSEFVIAVSRIKNGGDDKAALSQMLASLSEQSDYLLIDAVAALTKNQSAIDSTVSMARTFSGPVIGTIIGAIYSLEKTILLNNSQRISVYELLRKYIAAILDKTDKTIVFVFDHFHLGSSEYRDAVQILTNNFHHEGRVKFIFATDENMQRNSPEIYEMLMDSFGLIPYCVKPFQTSQENYFAYVLQYAFPDLKSDNSALNVLFSLCKGNIGKLKEGLRQYIAKRGSESRISIEDFCAYLRMHDQGSFSPTSTSQSLILSALRAYAKPIQKETLYQCACFILKKEFHIPKLPKMHFEDDIVQLIRLEMIDLAEGMVSLSNWNFIDLPGNINLAIYDFYLNSISFDKNKNDLAAEDRILLMRLALRAHPSELFQLGWFQITWLHDNNEVYEACNYAAALLACDSKKVFLNIEKLIAIAGSLYNFGKYQSAEKLLLSSGDFSSQTSSREQNYNRLFLLGKCENLRGALLDACISFKKALRFASSLDEETQAKEMLQLVLMEQPGGQKEAQEICDQMIKILENKKAYTQIECFAARTLVDFYPLGDYNNILFSALDQARQFGNCFACASLEVALGLQYLREGKIKDAEHIYSEALERLYIIRPHEQSYVYNDLGTCEMLKGNYDDALYYFIDGLSINKSPYTRTVLKTNCGICYALMGRNDDATEICDELCASYLNSDNHFILARASMAVCFIIIQCGLADTSPNPYDAIFDDCIDLARKNTEKKRQLERLKSFMDKKAMKIPYSKEEIRASQGYYGAVFQPWITTLHHD